MTKQTDSRHTFVVCAYKDSEYLSELIDSLIAQTVGSKIVIATSTPTDRMMRTAEHYGLEVFVNDRAEGIASDWNFAYSIGDADYVTLAHQDDIYRQDFTEKTMGAVSGAKNPVIIYTDYYEIRPEGDVFGNKLLNVKRVMNVPIGMFPASRFWRKRVFSMGCPVSCPSVTFNKKRFPDFRFDTGFRNSMDWEAWYRLAFEKGEFLYVKEPLLGHRIHEGSETTNTIASGARYREDLIMFEKSWPKSIARFIHGHYTKSMKSNDLKDHYAEIQGRDGG